MNETTFDAVFNQVTTAMGSGSYDLALMYIEQAPEFADVPIIISYRAYCMAKGQGRIRDAIVLCRDTIRQEPYDPRHYLILGRLLLLSGQKTQAIKIFRAGLKHGRNAEIIQELKDIGLRKTPMFSSIERSHPLNRITGRLLTLCGLR
jgi:tetratricopeptide (TPR) repeat protein